MNFENQYGVLDRLLHRLAFSTFQAQLGLADLESALFRKELRKVDGSRPVLITGLPRSGTTALLGAFASTQTFAAHTYRDMPFVLCPMLWGTLAKPFRRRDNPRERAHADGIQISLDSPEAFEEVLWKTFFPERYRGGTLPVWQDAKRRDFAKAFRDHSRRIVALRRRRGRHPRRYVSKNNLNLARIPVLWDALPDARVLVPFRDPIQHAASLRHQHVRFAEMHAGDPFARRYMEAIGHYDFGANLRPIDFDGWIGATPDLPGPEHLAYWVRYWIATYRHVLHHEASRKRLGLIRFEALGERPDLTPIAQHVKCEPSDLNNQRRQFRAPRAHDVDPSHVPSAWLDEARGLYEQLSERCLLARGVETP
ncbi:MAG: sulfotransferase [Planctomycetota bacterium]|nr:sulfotransferase [Planctomycetota bacterium]